MFEFELILFLMNFGFCLLKVSVFSFAVSVVVICVHCLVLACVVHPLSKGYFHSKVIFIITFRFLMVHIEWCVCVT